MKKSSVFVSLSGIKGLKMVGKTWKTTNELDVRKLTGQMKMCKKCGNWFDLTDD
jgi:hypothetical protein